jgi:hypothetical protein
MGAKMIPETVLKTRLKTKDTTGTSVLVKYLLWSLSEGIRAFSVFLED